MQVTLNWVNPWYLREREEEMRAVIFSYNGVNKMRFFFFLTETALVSKILTSSESFMNLESIYYVEKTARNFFQPSYFSWLNTIA